MFNFTGLNIVQGSANTVIREDPVEGSNAIAAIVRINNFMDEMARIFNATTPSSKGSLMSANANGEPVELTIGPTNYCLTVSPTTPSGLAWQERVDTLTDQSIRGDKTFLGTTILNDFTSLLDGHIQGSLVVDGDLIAHSLRSASTLNVAGHSALTGNLNVQGLTNLLGNVDISGSSTLRAPVSALSTLHVTGATTLDSTLQVRGAANLQSTLHVAGQTTLGSGLAVTGSTTTGGSASVQGNVSVGGQFSAIGVASLSSSLSVGTLLTVNMGTTTRTLTVIEGMDVAGDASFGQDINVLANANIHTLNVSHLASFNGGIAVTGATQLNDLSLTGGLNVAGLISTGSDLTVLGTSTLRGPVNISAPLHATNTVDIGGALTVGANSSFTGAISARSNLTVQGSLTVNSSTLLHGSTHVDGTFSTDSDVVIDGGLTVGGLTLVNGPLTANTLISAGDAQLGGRVIATGAAISGNVNVQGTLALTGDVTANKITSVFQEVQDDLEVLGDTVLRGALNVLGSITSPNLSGVNTGDELPGTNSHAGVVKVYGFAGPGSTSVYPKTAVDNLFIPNALLAVPNGVATLDDNAKLRKEQLPPEAIVTTRTVATQGDMLSLTAQEGDIAIRTDLSKAFILSSGNPTVLSSWIPLTFTIPAGAVTSVFNRVGNISPQVGDYDASYVTYTPPNGLVGQNVQAAITEAFQKHIAHVGDTQNPHNLTAQIIGAIPIANMGVPSGVATLDAQGLIPTQQLRPTRLVRTFSNSDLVAGYLTLSHGLNDIPNQPTILNAVGKVVIADDYQLSLSQVSIDLNSFIPLSGTWTAIVSL